ncbi:MAG: exodeoxyribonuclease V subunit gamma, partial [Geodermatophilaceae bacterium]
VTVDLGGGRRLTGSVPGVRGGTVAAASYSRLGPRHRLAGWIRLLALAAGDDEPWQAVTVGRYRRDRAEGSILVPPPDPLTVLRDLVGLRDEGLCQPLPLPPAAAAAYAERRQRGDALTEAMAAAEAAYGGMYGDHTDRHLEYVFGTDGAWERIGAEPGDGTEPTRFGSLAVRLWAPLLAAEQRRTA